MDCRYETEEFHRTLEPVVIIDDELSNEEVMLHLFLF